jgi:hypothetical protein
MLLSFIGRPARSDWSEAKGAAWINKETIAMQKQEQLAPKTSVLVEESECSLFYRASARSEWSEAKGAAWRPRFCHFCRSKVNIKSIDSLSVNTSGPGVTCLFERATPKMSESKR